MQLRVLMREDFREAYDTYKSKHIDDPNVP